MGIAAGVYKKISVKRQADLGVKSPAGAAGTARYLRRVTSTLDLKKATYQSEEILASQQVRDMRHGVRSVAGSISGELSIGGYQQFFESVLRQNVVAAATTGALATIAANAAGTFTRTGGSYITDGFKIGDVVRVSGYTTTGVANNAKNAIIIALTATVMTLRALDGSAFATKAAGDNVTIAVVGKKTFVPQANHARHYYTIEHWFSDVAQSEQFSDCIIGGANISLPATGMAKVEFPIMGLDMQTGVAEYFTTPANAATGAIVAAVNGVLVVNGNVVAVITGLEIKINGNYSAIGGIVGSNVDPDILPGVVAVDGSVSALFLDATLRDLFLSEGEASIAVALTGSNAANADFIAFNMPRCKFTDATKDDGKGVLTQTLPFVALENVAGGAGQATEATTISIQDSTFA